MSPEMIQLLVDGTWETLYMTIVSTAVSYVMGIPIVVIL